MLEIEGINQRMDFLNDRLVNIAEHLEDESYRYELSEQQKEWKVEWDHLNSVLVWWNAQYNYIMDRVRGPHDSGFQVTIGDPEEPKPIGSVKVRWESPRTLLNRLDRRGYTLAAILREWARQLTVRGLLTEEDIDGVVFDKPTCPFLEAKGAEQRQRFKEFDADLMRILEKVREHAEGKGRHGGLEHRKALGLYNRKYHSRYHNRQTLNDFVKELAHEKLLPGSYRHLRNTQDVVKALLGR